MSRVDFLKELIRFQPKISVKGYRLLMSEVATWSHVNLQHVHQPWIIDPVDYVMAIYQILELLLTTRLDLGHIQPFLLLNKLFHNHCPDCLIFVTSLEKRDYINPTFWSSNVKGAFGNEVDPIALCSTWCSMNLVRAILMPHFQHFLTQKCIKENTCNDTVGFNRFIS